MELFQYGFCNLFVVTAEMCLKTVPGTVSEFNEFKPRFKSPKNRFQLSAGLNLKKLNTILSGTNHI